MQIVESTMIVGLVLVFMAARGPNRGLVWLFALAPFGMMAAFNLPAVGGTSITGTDLAVVTLVGLLLMQRSTLEVVAGHFRLGGPGIMLLMFMGYATIGTLFLPRIFEEATQVFGIGRVGNALGIVERPLRPSNGNLSQLLRIYLSFAAFLAVATIAVQRPDPKLFLRCIKVATLVHVCLGIVDITTNFLNVEDLLAPIRTANYALTLGQRMAGLNRMIGGFPEASSFGYFSLGLLGFWTAYWFQGQDRSRTTALFLLATLAVTIRSTSSSAYVGAGVFAVVFVTYRVLSQNSGVMRKRSAGILIAGVAMIPLTVMTAYLMYQTVPGFADFIDRSLLTKLNSSSGEERMAWNAQALRNFVDTGLLGAGLGSVRASNWVVSLLASTGIVGAAFMMLFLVRLIRLPMTALPPDTRAIVYALKFGCVGFLCRAVVVKASPNLDIIFFAFAGACVGLVAAATVRSSAGNRSQNRLILGQSGPMNMS